MGVVRLDPKSVCFALGLTILLGCGGQDGTTGAPGMTSTGATGGASGVGTSSTGSAGSGIGGAGGGLPVDMCVLTSMKVCQSAGCHGGTPISAGLDLETNVLTRDYKTLVDHPNHGDPAGCTAGQFKLIDSAAPESSLIYAKLPVPGSTPPCGLRMPVIGNFADADRVCVLNWIDSVIAASR